MNQSIKNPTEYVIALIAMPIVWLILVLFFPMYLVGYSIILIHKKLWKL